MRLYKITKNTVFGLTLICLWLLNLIEALPAELLKSIGDSPSEGFGSSSYFNIIFFPTLLLIGLSALLLVIELFRDLIRRFKGIV